MFNLQENLGLAYMIYRVSKDCLFTSIRCTNTGDTYSRTKFPVHATNVLCVCHYSPTIHSNANSVPSMALIYHVSVNVRHSNRGVFLHVSHKADFYTW